MLEHLSWSSMNSFENNIHDFYTRYVLWEEPNFPPVVKEAMEFGKIYEMNLMEHKYKGWDTQKECEEIIGGYKLYGLFDFYNADERKVVECKTKSWVRTEKDIHSSWQFRFYNWWCICNGYEFILHQYNKKTWEIKEEKISWYDENFIDDFIRKAQQIERFLKQFNVEIKHYDIQKD